MKFKIALALAALLMVTGCATSRSVVSVGSEGAYNNANPTAGQAVKIEVTDVRIFEARPPTPDIPSLKDGDIRNTATTARAIGRKRNGYGKALGDILLPEGQTVSMITTDAIANGFKQAGYRVLKPGEPGYDQAADIKVKVKQYWSWVDIGFWALTLHCRAEVDITGPVKGLEKGMVVLSEAQEKAGAAFEETWQDIANQGLSALTTEVAQKLPRQSASN